jgi:hypothetical protein
MTYLPPINGGRINATISGNTAGVGTLVASGTLTLAGGNNITLSQNGNAITISGGAAGGGSNTFGMSNLGNTSGTTGVISGSAVRFAFAGGNNVTLSQSLNASSGTITISAASQTNQTAGLYALGNTTQSSSMTRDARSLSFNGLGGATVGYSNGSIQISAPQTVAQTNQTVGLYALGNTTQNSLTTLDARSLSFNGLGGVSVGYSNGSVQISGATGGGGGGGIALANAQTTYATGTANLIVAGGALTIASGANQSYNFSVPQTSSLSATGAVSISTNGSTISVGVPNFSLSAGTTSNTLNNVVFSDANGVSFGLDGSTMTASVAAAGGGATLSRFEYMEGFFTSLGAAGQGSLSLNHMYVPFNVTGTAVKLGGSLSAATNTSATVASVNMSLWMGIYTLNGSSLSLASSGSANNGFQWSHSASTSGNTSIQSMRQMTVPMNVNMTPGQYWVAAAISSATTYTSVAFSIYGNNQVAAGATGAVLTPIGSGTTANRDAMLFQGIYTTQTSAGPVSISGGHINNTSASNVMRANFYNAIYNATY